MVVALLVLFYFITPFIINYFCYKYTTIRKIGAIIIAYLVGLIFGNIGVLPEGFSKTQDLLTTITIPVALPLLLFSMNIKSWFTIAGTTFKSLILGVVSVIIPVVIGYFWFAPNIPENWKVAGMLAGVYTGGTPNLAAIGTALEVRPDIYVLTNSYDMVISAIFIFAMMTVGQRFLLKFLPAFKSPVNQEDEQDYSLDQTRDKHFFDLLKPKNLFPLIKVLAVAILIFGIGGGLSLLVPKNAQMVTVILTITTLGIIASLIPSINKVDRSFDLGMYFILVFSIVVASMADFSNFSSEYIHLLYYVIFAVFGSFIIHAILAYFFKVDADNVIIVATALACSPPFVPLVAGALKNKAIIISGLTVGIIGYAIGNYLGVSIAYILKGLL